MTTPPMRVARRGKHRVGAAGFDACNKLLAYFDRTTANIVQANTVPDIGRRVERGKREDRRRADAHPLDPGSRAIIGLERERGLVTPRRHGLREQIDHAESPRESPALLVSLPEVIVTAWVGMNERPEFLRQSELPGYVWPSVEILRAAGRHHLNILDPLCQAQSALANAVSGC